MNIPFKSNKPKTVVACDLSALEKNDRERVMTNFYEIINKSQKIRALKDGYAIFFEEVSSDFIVKLAEFVGLDSICCPFIKHAIINEPDHAGTWLQLTGGKAVKKYLANELSQLWSDKSVFKSKF